MKRDRDHVIVERLNGGPVLLDMDSFAPFMVQRLKPQPLIPLIPAILALIAFYWKRT